MLEGEAPAQELPKTTLLPVKSDTNLAAKKRNTGGSPPPSTRLLRHVSGGSSEINGSPEEKRHISFNTRVDQCIAIDYHEPEGAYSDGAELDDESEDEDSNASDDGEVLTMRSNRSMSPPSRQGSSSSLSSHSGDMHSIIAKLAPTRLKTTDVYPAPSPAVVDPSNFAAQFAPTSSRLSSQPQHSYDAFEEDEPRSMWEEDSSVDYFNSGFMDRGNDEDDDENEEHFSVAGTPGSGAKAKSRSLPIGSDSDQSNGAEVSSASSATSSSSSAPTAASAHEPAQPRSILKRRPAPTHDEASGDNKGSQPEANEPPKVVGAGSAFLAANNQMAGDTSDAESDDSGRGRTPQRLGSSASYERLQDASRRSGAIGTGGSVAGSSPSGSADGQRVQGPNSPPERERRGSFRGRDGDGHERSGAAARLNLGSPAEELPSDSTSNAGRSSVSDDDGDSDSRASARARRGHKGKAGGGQSSSMSPAGSQRLSVDLDNLPSNDPAVMGVPPTSGGQGGPTPLNTPTLALARNRSKAKADDGESSAGSTGASRTPSSPVMPRRTSATGALVAPSDADRQAGVRVPLADDYVEEDEGGIVGRAVEIVNTARDLIAAVWPRSR